MKLSAKARYAVRILIDLARHDSGGPVRTADISARTGVTVRFIEQILKPLKRDGLVHSTRGAAGGYTLARPPQDVSLATVIRTIEGTLSLTRCCENPSLCPRLDDCPTHHAWLRVTKAMEAELEGITLQELMGGQERPEGCTL